LYHKDILYIINKLYNFRLINSCCRGGGIGRHVGLKIPWKFISVPVQVRPSAPLTLEFTIMHIENIFLNDFLKQLNAILNINGAQLYFVGGMVRDYFLGNNIKDIDLIVTNISCEKFEKLLNKQLHLTGKSFGVYKLRIDSYEIDIAFPRKEYSTGLHHRDFQIEHGEHISLEEDLLRRDFTMNAMATDIGLNTLIDPYNGKKDLEKGLLRQLSKHSLNDDYLRALRAIQFVSRFGFNIEKNTLKACKQNNNLINTISKERISIELKKFFQGKHLLKGLKYLKKINLMANITNNLYSKQWKILQKYNNTKDFDEITFFSIYYFFSKNKENIWNYVHLNKQNLNNIYLINKNLKKININNICKMKKLDKETIKYIQTKTKKEQNKILVKFLLNILKEKNFFKFLLVQQYIKLINKKKYEYLLNLAKSIIQNKEPYLLAHLEINGNNLKKDNIQGKEIGILLEKRLLGEILDGQSFGGVED
jgi:tRNA nucleotidyltransferase (CCA-adding enzyme)